MFLPPRVRSTRPKGRHAQRPLQAGSVDGKDGEEFAGDGEMDVHTGETQAIYPLRVILIGWTRVKLENLNQRFRRGSADLPAKFLGDMDLQGTLFQTVHITAARFGMTVA